MEIGSVVQDEELLKKLSAIVQKEKVEKKYDLEEGEIVTDEKTIEALNKLKLEDENKIKKEETWFDKSFKFVSNIVTGKNRTEFENMGEIYEIKTKSMAKDLALNIGFISNADQKAHLDMITRQYPGTVISKDKFDNIMITLPPNAVDGDNRTFYLDKPGISFNGAINTFGQTLLYIPGAGLVSRHITTGALKKITAHGFTAMTTSVATDVVSAVTVIKKPQTS